MSSNVKTKAKAAAGKAKPAAKKTAATKTAAKKPAAKPVVKKAVAKKAAPKPAAKKAAAKKSAVKAPVKKAAVKKAASAKPVAKKAPPAKKAAPAKAPVAKTKSSAKAAAPQPVVTPPAAPAEAPARTTKASARLAQLTVPSLTQDGAYAASKTSYVSSLPSVVIAAPVPSAVKKDPKLANNWKIKSAEELTDEELIAMPDSEYMNDKQLAAFRLRLMQLKQDILNNAGETTEHLREDTIIVPDPADRATIEEEHALELRTRDRERKLLKKIEQSIARIDSGDYGYCDETGEPIGVSRLLARPTATLSLEAQQRRELKQKMFGD